MMYGGNLPPTTLHFRERRVEQRLSGCPVTYCVHFVSPPRPSQDLMQDTSQPRNHCTHKPPEFTTSSSYSYLTVPGGGTLSYTLPHHLRQSSKSRGSPADSPGHHRHLLARRIESLPNHPKSLIHSRLLFCLEGRKNSLSVFVDRYLRSHLRKRRINVVAIVVCKGACGFIYQDESNRMRIRSLQRCTPVRIGGTLQMPCALCHSWHWSMCCCCWCSEYPRGYRSGFVCRHCSICPHQLHSRHCSHSCPAAAWLDPPEG